MRSLVDSGAKLAFGSDWPVSDPNPLLGVYTAVYRAVADKPSWNDAESLSMQEALDAYTEGSGFQLGYDAHESIADGIGDFILLSANPHESTRDNFSQIKVLETYIDGVKVWPAC